MTKTKLTVVTVDSNIFDIYVPFICIGFFNRHPSVHPQPSLIFSKIGSYGVSIHLELHFRFIHLHQKFKLLVQVYTIIVVLNWMIPLSQWHLQNCPESHLRLPLSLCFHQHFLMCHQILMIHQYLMSCQYLTDYQQLNDWDSDLNHQNLNVTYAPPQYMHFYLDQN